MQESRCASHLPADSLHLSTPKQNSNNQIDYLVHFAENNWTGMHRATIGDRQMIDALKAIAEALIGFALIVAVLSLRFI